MAQESLLEMGSSFLSNSFVLEFLNRMVTKYLDRVTALSVYRNKFDFISSQLLECLQKNYNTLSTLNSLVFKNKQIFLRDIFIPLTLRTTERSYIPRCTKKIDGFPYELLNDFGCILITDSAGMGKSTLSKIFFLDIIDNKNGIPIFIELRRITKTKGIFDEIKEQLDIKGDQYDDILTSYLKMGNFIFILDGYDEIRLTDRDSVTADIMRTVNKFFIDNNKFIITSRPEMALTSFGSFQEFIIEPLTQEESFNLLSKYDNNGEVSKRLISKIKEDGVRSVEEFLTNPLLTSMLFLVFDYKNIIPFKKHLFYRQVYDAYFETHDLSKGGAFVREKKSGLDIDDFHRVLKYIGFNCLKNQEIEFSKDRLLSLIDAGKRFCINLNFISSDFLEDILKAVPLFIEDGNYYRWAHKSLQEYFAAQFIYNELKDKEIFLGKLYDHQKLENYANVLDLYYDIDYKTFRNVIIYRLLLDYKIYSDTTYKLNHNIDENEIILRKECTFLSRYFFVDKGIRKEIYHEFYHQIYPNSNFTPAPDSEPNPDFNLFHHPEFVIFKITNKFDSLPSLHSFSIGKSYIAYCFIDNKVPIYQVLLSKNISFLKKITPKPSKLEFEKLDAKIIELTDDPDSFLNSNVYFKNVTEYIQSLNDHFIYIDHHNALIELKNIESDIDYEKNNHSLYDF